LASKDGPAEELLPTVREKPGHKQATVGLERSRRILG
jgi:hypothetical protein